MVLDNKVISLGKTISSVCSSSYMEWLWSFPLHIVICIGVVVVQIFFQQEYHWNFMATSFLYLDDTISQQTFWFSVSILSAISSEMLPSLQCRHVIDISLVSWCLMVNYSLYFFNGFCNSSHMLQKSASLIKYDSYVYHWA